MRLGTLAIALLALSGFGGELPPRRTLARTDPTEFLRRVPPVDARPPVGWAQADRIASLLGSRSPSLSRAELTQAARCLQQEARTLSIDPWLLMAVIGVESNFNYLAVSPVGAEGWMQLMPATARAEAESRGLNWEDGHSFDPVLNIQLGSRYLAELVTRFGRLDLALTAYNRGPDATRSLLRTHGALPREVRAFYSDKVMTRYRQFLHQYQSAALAAPGPGTLKPL
jgi:soluble lytic murein transglycosylase